MSRCIFPLLRAGCWAAWIGVGSLMIGCASDPVSNRPSTGDVIQASAIAASMEGTPYRYGGHNPARGFDCSGLVYYSYQRAGMSVPRSTEAQRQHSRKISASSLARGDLVFFNQQGKFSSHVGIYLGNSRFVHAPSGGKHVRIDNLNSDYWQKHFVDARRF